MGGEASVSSLADSVHVQFGDDADVSREDVIRALKASSSPSSNDISDGKSLYDHVALVYKHSSGVSSSRSKQRKAAKNSSMKIGKDSSRRALQQGAQVEGLLEFGFLQPVFAYSLYNTQELLTNPALFYNLPFRVTCPNGDIETPNNECSSSGLLHGTAVYESNSIYEDIWQIEDLEPIRYTCGSLSLLGQQCTNSGFPPGGYIYSIPTKYFKQDVLYSDIHIQITFNDGNVSDGVLTKATPRIPNPFGATGSTIRELYGVPLKYQGSVDQVQFTSLGANGNNYCYNVSAQNEYLDLQGITNRTELEVINWDPPSTPNDCEAYYDLSSGESMLDISALQSVAPLATTQAAPGNAKDSTTQDIIKAWDRYFDTLLESKNPGVVSWSWSEATFIQELYNQIRNDPMSPSMSEAKTMVSAIKLAEAKLHKMAAMGYTIFVAAGDEGASGTIPGCIGPDNPSTTEFFPGESKATCTADVNSDDECKVSSLTTELVYTDSVNFAGIMTGINVGYLAGNLLLGWPVQSPWVTVVGGTQLLVLEKNAPAVEVVCSGETSGGITSSGGFAGSGTPLAAVYKRPKWQDKQVQHYLDNNGLETFPGFPDDLAFGYNPRGRAYPDIAAYANAWTIIGGEPNAVVPDGPSLPTPRAGTSLAAPLTAGLFTLINQALVEKGYKEVGYANPMIYWIAERCPEAYNDITIGNNQFSSGGEQCEYGFNAAPGWGATTGLGSINFDNFVACAVKFQDNNGQGLGVGKDPPRPQQSCATKNQKQCEKDDSCDLNEEDGICFDKIGLSSLKEGSVEPEAHIQQANQALVHTSTTMLAGLTVIWLGILLM